jgi:hypothetical protein
LSLSEATTSSNGALNATDKTKLNQISFASGTTTLTGNLVSTGSVSGTTGSLPL